eukprot:TRINITY_DN4364_c0_g1_i1.p1 TRINITY_DN4364_c0_g1~~TRINITY_DN4364_c0_g1_i1.p1  ORF type:complete len:453 (-),score=119.16 TRINITY_DN4364_c0_g1_i1:450-1808(-)
MDYDSSDVDMPSVAVRKQAAALVAAARTQRADGSSSAGGAMTNGVRSASYPPPLPANAAHAEAASAAGEGSGSGNCAAMRDASQSLQRSRNAAPAPPAPLPLLPQRQISGNRGRLVAFVEAQAQQPNVVLLRAVPTGMAAVAAASGGTAGGSSSGMLARHVQGAHEGQAAGLSSGNRGGYESAGADGAHVAQTPGGGVTASAALPPHSPAAERVEAADLSPLQHRRCQRSSWRSGAARAAATSRAQAARLAAAARILLALTVVMAVSVGCLAVLPPFCWSLTRAAANKVAVHMGHAAAPTGRLCFGDNIPQVAGESCAKWVPCPPAAECAGGAVVRCAHHFELADNACIPEASVRAEAERAKRVLHDNVELHYCRGGALRGLPLPADRCLDEAAPCSTPREVFHLLLHQGLLRGDFTVLHGSGAFALTREEHLRVKNELPLTCRLRRALSWR